jgi:hypothetical protein
MSSLDAAFHKLRPTSSAAQKVYESTEYEKSKREIKALQSNTQGIL